jgi:hypothetical protein
METPPPLQTPARSRRDAAAIWLAWLLVSVLVFSIPGGYPGERIVLLACQGAACVGAVILIWRERYLRLVPIALTVLQFYPVRTGLTRAGLTALVLAAWIALLYVNRRHGAIVAALAAVPLAAAAFVALPARRVDPTLLRTQYVRSLMSYHGARYVWGGENFVGIDCSGLVRCGWMDANLRTGLLTANSGPVRNAIRNWWRDCSAKELGNGAAGRTRLVLTTPSLDRLDYTLLAVGDVAVSEGGEHTLAYIGDSRWIEAEPRLNGVEVVRAPDPQDVWLETPMRIVRWAELDAGEATARR